MEALLHPEAREKPAQASDDSARILRRNAVRVTGAGREALIFGHGFGCDQTLWHPVAPAFEKQRRVVLFDHVGAGASDLSAYHPARYASLDGYADDLLEIVDALQLDRPVYVGHSVAAMIGVIAAVKKPDAFSRLVLVGPSPCYLNDGDYHGGFDRESLEELLDFMDSNYLGWSQAIAPQIMGNPDRPALGDRLTRSFCSTDPDIARAFARTVFFSDDRAVLPRLATPSLIMQCADDIIAPETVGAYMRANTPGSVLVQLRATGHCPHVSHPAEVIDVIGRYLEGALPEDGHA